jgi:hypothetical protein
MDRGSTVHLDWALEGQLVDQSYCTAERDPDGSRRAEVSRRIEKSIRMEMDCFGEAGIG